MAWRKVRKRSGREDAFEKVGPEERRTRKGRSPEGVLKAGAGVVSAQEDVAGQVCRGALCTGPCV